MNFNIVQTRKTGAKLLISIFRILFLLAFSYILIYPLVYMISESLKSVSDYADPTVVWVPKYPSFENFIKAKMVVSYFESFWNTIRFQFVSSVIEVISCSFFAYGLARFKMRFKNVMMFFLVLTIIVPDIMVIIPRMMNFKQLDFLGILKLFYNITGFDLRPNIVDSPLAFYLPSLLGVGLKGGLLIFIYMQFYKSFPVELEEAAWLDGAGPFQTYYKIILPSAGVVTLTVFILSTIWHWNDYLLSLMYTYNNRPLAVYINDIKQYMYMVLKSDSTSVDSYGVPLTACILFILPPLLMYMVLQRKFIQSIDRVGIVG